MHNFLKLLVFSLSVPLIYCCSSSKISYHSYRIGTYIEDSNNHLSFIDDYISYGNYLFEFKEQATVKTLIHARKDSVARISSYDTIGVYLLSSKNRLFYDFDTFALKNKVTKTGRLEDKPYGLQMDYSNDSSFPNVSFSPPTKANNGNTLCFMSDISLNNQRNDTLATKALLIKGANFNSKYKLSGWKFPDKNYCIVGVQVNYLKLKRKYIEGIELMRPLNKEEKDICESMIKASKLCVTDTIKSRANKK